MTETSEKTGDELEEVIAGFPEEQILKFFRFSHLPKKVQEVSCIFADAAICVLSHAPRCAERTVALRKLLEGKDAAVRAAL